MVRVRAYAHAKSIVWTGAAMPLLKAAGVADGVDGRMVEIDRKRLLPRTAWHSESSSK